MFTDCPGCRRQFHIYAKQLSAAKGLVKCGYCGKQFNALERLHDEPLPNLEQQIPVVTETQDGTEPEFDIPGTGRETNSEPVDEEFAAASFSSPEAFLQEQQQPEPGESAQQPKVTGREAETDFELSEMLLDEAPRESTVVSRILWGGAVLLLVLLISTQLIWFNRDLILSRYPELIPWVNKLCADIECETIRHRDVSAIKLINRDVRDHPRYEKALLVNATMSNQLHTPQPFPVVQLALYDTNGELIAHRRFQPEEYLDESINILQGMRPGVPVHFVLEVTGPTEGAVSFEFEFL